MVDRFTFAAFDVAHRLNISYVVNNPYLLLDLDDPPYHIPTPFTNNSTYPIRLYDRAVNIYHRVRYKLDMLMAFTKLNAVLIFIQYLKILRWLLWHIVQAHSLLTWLFC